MATVAKINELAPTLNAMSPPSRAATIAAMSSSPSHVDRHVAEAITHSDDATVFNKKLSEMKSLPIENRTETLMKIPNSATKDYQKLPKLAMKTDQDHVDKGNTPIKEIGYLRGTDRADVRPYTAHSDEVANPVVVAALAPNDSLEATKQIAPLSLPNWSDLLLRMKKSDNPTQRKLAETIMKRDSADAHDLAVLNAMPPSERSRFLNAMEKSNNKSDREFARRVRDLDHGTSTKVKVNSLR